MSFIVIAILCFCIGGIVMKVVKSVFHTAICVIAGFVVLNIVSKYLGS